MRTTFPRCKRRSSRAKVTRAWTNTIPSATIARTCRKMRRERKSCPSPAPKDFRRRDCTKKDGRPKKKRSEEHTSELQSRLHLVCRLLLEKKKQKQTHNA